MLGRLWNRTRMVLTGRTLPVWYDPAYRLPITSMEGALGMEPRRADLVVTTLRALGVLRAEDLHSPAPVGLADLARVHSAELLDSLTGGETLAAVFGVDPSDVPVNEVWRTLRLATGGTLAAARSALTRRGPALNLLGGFHHAGPARAAGFCPVNDLAVAVARLRAEKRLGSVAVLDLDAHPPDGTAECFEGDPRAWIGSISGADFGPLPGVDETVLRGVGDADYLEALAALLRRMPRAELTFVLAGGDVLEGDRFGGLALTVEGARRRDLMVARALEGRGSVWLPAGGYHEDSWRVLANTGLVLTLGEGAPSAGRFDALRARFEWMARDLPAEAVGGGDRPSLGDVMADLRGPGEGRPRLLGFYTEEGIELALERYGILAHLERLCFTRFRVVLDTEARGDRLRLFGTSEGVEHLLFEAVLEARGLGMERVLFVHWLTLQNPRARFGPHRARLPGQEHPGLGLAREAGELLRRMAARLGLAGVAFCPAYLHTAYAARRDMQFADAARQGRFEALLRDLADRPLAEASALLAAGRVRLGAEPYAWEATEMVHWLDGRVADRAVVEAEAARSRFSVEER